jgi:hypothetical protein
MLEGFGERGVMRVEQSSGAGEAGPARRLPGLLRSLPPTLTPQRARPVAAHRNRRIDTYTSR